MLKVFRHRSLKWMIALSFIICHLSFSPVRAQIGTWRNYLSYAEPQQIQAASNDLFVLASGSLYLYNKQDQSIYTYDKTNGMSDVDITHIKWCPQAKRLVVVYSDSNIDLVEVNGNVTNVNDIYARAITGGKTIYSITINGQYAYLACEFGIIKINVKDAEISETYQLGFPVNAIALDNTNIYANSPTKGVWTATLTSNLIDPANWSQTTTAPNFSEDLADYNNNIELVKTLQPGGPKYNAFGYMRFVGNKLFTSNSSIAVTNNTGCIQVYDGTNWTRYDTDLIDRVGHNLFQVFSLDIDPQDVNHLYASGQTGLYEYRNGQFVREYSNDNGSPFETASTVGGNNKNYVMVTSIIYHKDGSLWCFNSIAPNTSLVELKANNTTWEKHNNSKFFVYDDRSLEDIRSLMFDSRGLLWMVNNMHRLPSAVCYNRETGETIRYDQRINQDGTTYTFQPKCLAEDKQGNIWVGTTEGPFLITTDMIANNQSDHYNQVKVPRNDGTDYADYLLSGINVTSIVIDGAGRKWIGTIDNGVYVISSDNMTQVHHFTVDNSPLLSNNIHTLAINNYNGEVFIGTELGLCSYISDATTPTDEMIKDNVWAYPNPVQPDYTGPITIVGLTFNADIKILSSNGAVVAEGRSNGGSFTWNGCDKSGQRVASGVYMVVTATSDGKKGTVCKIAIIN